MKLSSGLLLQAFFGIAIAASEPATVYNYPAAQQDLSQGTPSLSPEEARLVIAQRLGVSQYHSLQGATEDGIRYVNAFGGQQSVLFEDTAQDEERYRLIIMMEGVTAELAKSFAAVWESEKPAFKITDPPSTKANSKLIEDLMTQKSGRKECEPYKAIGPINHECWAGKSNFVHFDMKTTPNAAEGFSRIAATALRTAKTEAMELMVILMPESSRSTKRSSEPYGVYDMPPKARHQRRQNEEIIDTGAAAAKVSSIAGQATASATSPAVPFKTIIPRCHGSMDSCITATGNCSGHGLCKKKFGTDEKDACYSCGCVASVNITNGLRQSTYWGGSACQKEDVSSQFWLIAGFSVAAVGIASWGIGMLFSIGEEKLPGVIGAGVSGPKAR